MGELSSYFECVANNNLTDETFDLPLVILIIYTNMVHDQHVRIAVIRNTSSAIIHKTRRHIVLQRLESAVVATVSIAVPTFALTACVRAVDAS